MSYSADRARRKGLSTAAAHWVSGSGVMIGSMTSDWREIKTFMAGLQHCRAEQRAIYLKCW